MRYKNRRNRMKSKKSWKKAESVNQNKKAEKATTRPYHRTTTTTTS
jgi:hypothetical protein